MAGEKLKKLKDLKQLSEDHVSRYEGNEPIAFVVDRGEDDIKPLAPKR